MAIIVRDDGFHEDTWERDGGLFIDLEKFGQDVAAKVAERTALDIPNDVTTQSLLGLFDNVAMIQCLQVLGFHNEISRRIAKGMVFFHKFLLNKLYSISSRSVRIKGSLRESYTTTLLLHGGAQRIPRRRRHR